MPRLGETRLTAALFGLAAGLATAILALPAAANHVIAPLESPQGGGELNSPTDFGAIRGIVSANTVSEGGIQYPGVGVGGSFTYTYIFGYDLQGFPNADSQLGVNSNRVGLQSTGFSELNASLTGPNGPIGISVSPLTDQNGNLRGRSIESVVFSVMDTAGAFPYTLTISGVLENTLGTLTGEVTVTPLPAAALVLLSALGGLVAVRRYRSQEGAAAA